MKKFKDNKILALFISFFKIGAFTFGGGYAMIPLIEREMVEEKKWMSEEEIVNIVAVSQSTPGPIAINAATFVGYKVAGFWGSTFATIGVVLPSFVIISIISVVLKQVEGIKVVKYAFLGIRAGVLALLIKAFLTMMKSCPKSKFSYFILFTALVIVSFTSVSVFIVILCCAAVGLIYTLITERRVKS